MTGVSNPHSTSSNAGIHKLDRDRGGEWLRLQESYTDVVHNLHSEAFYEGIYNDDISDLVRGVADYIRCAEALAG